MKRTLVRPVSLVVVAAAFLTTLLWSGNPDLGANSNDLALHLALARGLAQNRTLDFWQPSDLGYPLLRVYQPLYHLTLALADGASGHLLGLPGWARVLGIALGVAIPLSLFLGVAAWLRAEGMRRDDARWVSSIAALLGAVAMSPDGLGFDPLQSIWTRQGLVTQAWATVFLVPALAAAVAHVRGSASPWPALGLAVLTWGTSLIVGFWLAAAVAFRGIVEAVLLRRSAPLFRLGVYFAGVAALTTFLWWPFVADAPWIHDPSPLTLPWLNGGFAPKLLVSALLRGTLLDGDDFARLARLPIFTLLFFLGAFAVVRRAREFPAASIFLLGGSALWFSLALGRHVWGPVLYALPVVGSYQWARFEGMIGLFATVIAAIGIRDAAEALLARSRKRGSDTLQIFAAGAAVVAATLLAQAPARRALASHEYAAEAKAGRGVALVREAARLLSAESTRTSIGRPRLRTSELDVDHVFIDIALAEHDVPLVGRVFLGTGIAAQLSNLWDGRSEWGQALLGVGSWLVPCGWAGDLPPGASVRPLGGGICIGAGRSSPRSPSSPLSPRESRGR